MARQKKRHTKIKAKEKSKHPRKVHKNKKLSFEKQAVHSIKKKDLERRVKKTLNPESTKDEKEAILEDLVFGNPDDLAENLEKKEEEETYKSKHGIIDRKPVWEDKDDTQLVSVKKVTEGLSNKKKTATIMLKGERYRDRLKKSFEAATGGTPSWADLDRIDKEKKDDIEGLTSVTNYIDKATSLPAGILDYNQHEPFQFTIKIKEMKSVEFHPALHLRLISGFQGFELLQGINYESMKKLTIEHFPVFTAHFNTEGNEVILGSVTKSFKIYDMMADKLMHFPKIKAIDDSYKNMMNFVMSPDGKFIATRGTFGHIHLISAKSKEWITSLKMNGNVECIGFNSDGSRMFSHGDDGEVYIWDMNTRSCVHRFYDDGCLNGTSIAVSRNNQYMACGASSGIVNIYDYNSCQSLSQPKPLRIIGNLTTKCDIMKFNSTSDMLAIGSSTGIKSIRLVQLPTMTVFSNFPDKPNLEKHRTEYSRSTKSYTPTCLDFSPNGGFFSVGTVTGLGHNYRLRFYENY